jgi:hypothetical protein
VEKRVIDYENKIDKVINTVDELKEEIDKTKKINKIILLKLL